MDSQKNQPCFGGDGSGLLPEGEESLRTIIGLVHPLVRNGINPPVLDIEHDIMVPALENRHLEWRELEKLCAVCTMVLEQVGSTVLTTLDTYLSTREARYTLTHLIDEMEQLNLLLIRANTTSFFGAFYIGMLTEVAHEPF